MLPDSRFYLPEVIRCDTCVKAQPSTTCGVCRKEFIHEKIAESLENNIGESHDHSEIESNSIRSDVYGAYSAPLREEVTSQEKTSVLPAEYLNRSKIINIPQMHVFIEKIWTLGNNENRNFRISADFFWYKPWITEIFPIFSDMDTNLLTWHLTHDSSTILQYNNCRNARIGARLFFVN